MQKDGRHSTVDPVAPHPLICSCHGRQTKMVGPKGSFRRDKNACGCDRLLRCEKLELFLFCVAPHLPAAVNEWVLIQKIVQTYKATNPLYFSQGGGSCNPINSVQVFETLNKKRSFKRTLLTKNMSNTRNAPVRCCE